MGGAGSAHLEEHKLRLCLVVERRLCPENHVPRLTKSAAAAAEHACCRVPALKLQQADDREREEPEHEHRARQPLGPESDNRACRPLPRRHLRLTVRWNRVKNIVPRSGLGWSTAQLGS